MILDSIEKSIKEKIENLGTPLADWNVKINRGILTGFNEAFIINDAKKNELIKKDPKSAEIIRPILRGRDIKPYYYIHSDLYLINTHNGLKGRTNPINVREYPEIKKHLDLFYEKISKRTDQGITPYNLRDCTYLEDFDRQKIIYPETTTMANFCLDSNGFVIDKTCFMLITEEPHFLIANLASKLFEFAYKNFFTSVELGNKGYQYNKHALIKLPVIRFDEVNNMLVQQINELVKQILQDPNKKTEALQVLDTIIFSLYNISHNEIERINSTH